MQVGKKLGNIKMNKNLLALFFCVLVLTIGYGISFPMLSISLDGMGVSGQLIGLNAAMPALGWLLGTPFLPKLQSRYGLKLVLLTCLIIAAIALISFHVWREFWPWMFFRFLFGGSLGLFYRGVEFWINGTSENSVRGRNIGIYSVCFMFGIAVGSGIQPMIGTEGFLPYLIVLGFVIVTGLVVGYQTYERLPEIGKATTVFSAAIVLASPIALLGVLAYGLFEDIPAYLMSVYALRNGLGEDIAAFTLTAVAIGNLIFPIPIGMISDRVSRILVLMVCAFAVMILSAVIPYVLNNSTIFLITLVVWGGFAGGVYCVALSIIGDRFKGKDLAIANASFGTIYAFGGIIGPIINGFAIDTLNSQGMMVSAGTIFGFFIILSMIIYIRNFPKYTL